MHPWHDSYVDDELVESAFPVIIEVPKGAKNKYELDKETGLLRLDRVLYSAVHYGASQVSEARQPRHTPRFHPRYRTLRPVPLPVPLEPEEERRICVRALGWRGGGRLCLGFEKGAAPTFGPRQPSKRGITESKGLVPWPS